METYFLKDIELTPEELADFEERCRARNIKRKKSFVESLNNKRLKKKCRSISLSEFKEYIDSGKLNKVISVCWKNGKFRVAAKGITNVEIKNEGEEFSVSFQDDEGNPELSVFDEKTPIKKINNGQWSFGLYIKK